LNLTHLIIDENENNPKFILDVLKNGKKYPFLIKEFDSTEFDFNYVLKLYKIDYKEFNNINN